MPIFAPLLTDTQKKLQKLAKKQFEPRFPVEPLPPTPTAESTAALVEQFAAPPSARAPTPPTQFPTATPTPITGPIPQRPRPGISQFLRAFSGQPPAPLKGRVPEPIEKVERFIESPAVQSAAMAIPAFAGVGTGGQFGKLGAKATKGKAKPTAAVPEAVVPEAVAPKAAEAGATGGVPPTVPPTAKVPPTPPEGFAANIRLSKYPEDIRATIKDWADANPQLVQEARRGVRSDAQVLADAKKLVEEMGGDFQKLQRRWKAGEAWNAEEITALRGVLTQKTNAVLEAAKAAKAVDSSANHASLLLAIEEQARVQEIVHGITAEAGRSMRAFRQETFNAIKANDLQRLDELLKRVGGKDKMNELADALTKLNLDDPIAVNDFIRSVNKPSMWDYVVELYYNSILSGPKTHIINGLSNTVTTTLSPLERALAVPFEQVFARLQGRQAERYFREVPADLFGASEGIREGAQSALYTLKNGISPTQATKWEFRPHAFRGVTGRIINTPSTMLEAADGLNRSINYRASLNALIVRTAKNEGKAGKELLERIAELKATPTAAIIKEADKVAEYRLFRQPLGTFASRVMGARDAKVLGLQPLRLVIPFLRTPINLVKFGLERSPAGLLNPTLWRNLTNKSPEASDQFARIFLGSAIAAGFGLYFGQGRLTGPAPTEAAARDRFYREGKQPFAVKIGDRWVQWQRVEPLNQTLSLLTAALQASEEEDATVDEKVAEAALTISQNLVSQTYVSSLSGLFDAMSQPERYGEKFLTRLATGFIPASSALRTAAQITDTTVRKPETLAQAAQVAIPGLSGNVAPALTAFGEPVERQSIPWFPINISKAKEDKVDAELKRLGVEIGFVGRTLGGETLTPTERFQYQMLAGQKAKETLTLILNLPKYQGMTDPAKEKAVRSVIDTARDQARAIILAARSGQPSGAPVSTEPSSAPSAPTGPAPDLEKYRPSKQPPKPSSKTRRTVDILERDENGRIKKSAIEEEVFA